MRERRAMEHSWHAAIVWLRLASFRCAIAPRSDRGASAHVIPTLFSVSYAGYWGQHALGLEDFLREAAARAADEGVMLGLQNHHDVGITVDAYEELLDDVAHPNLKAMFDPWSVALTGGDLEQAARRLAPRMVQTTLADYVRIERFA